MAFRPENFEAPPVLSKDEEKEILTRIKEEIFNLKIREFLVRPNVKNYDPEETYVIYDKTKIFVYNGELHRLRLARKEYTSFYICRPDRHV